MKSLISTAFKTLNPRHYFDLAEKKLSQSFKYFLALIFTAFILMSILAIPKLYSISSQLDKQVLDVIRLDVKADFETAKPISIPNDRPIITLDTTNNKEIDTELFLITDKQLYYNLLGRKGKIDINEYDFTADREFSKKNLIKILIMFIPSIFLFYYLAYVIKYLIIILPIAVISFVFLRKKKISFKQILTLSFYTSTSMIALEILTLPFYIKDYLLTYTPFVGINFSMIALTAYLTFYVTSIRINVNKDL